MPRPLVLLSSLLLTACVVTIILFFTLPGIYRAHMISKLHDPDPAVRQQGYSFAAARLHRPAVFQSILETMESTDDEELFMQLVQLLDYNGLWSQQYIPESSWLRRIQIIHDIEGKETNILAAQMLANRHDLADSPNVITMLERFDEHQDLGVRYAVLLSAAELAGAAQNPQAYRPLISRFSHDRDPGLSYQAWIIRGLLGFEPTAMEVENGLGVPDDFRQVYDYARGTLTAEQLAPRPPLEDMPGIDQILLGEAEVDHNALWPLLASDKPALRELGAVIAARRLDDHANQELARALLTSLNPNSRLSGALLVGLTGVEPVGITGDFASVLAAHPQWTEQQVRQFDDQQLHELGLARRNILDYWIENSQDFIFTQHLRLARWMQGRLPEMDGQVDLLRGMESFPATTLALAMLHRGQDDATLDATSGLDVIINPRGEPRADLLELLAGRRWVHVIGPYLFEDSEQGLPYAWWADRATQQMQTDVLRNWMLVHRGKR